MHEIIARIDHLSDGVGCFDPLQVVARLRSEFPEVIEGDRDPLWDTYEHFCGGALPSSEGARRIAFKDFRKRGPKVLFEIPLLDGDPIQGTAERYHVRVISEAGFPEDFRRRFTKFLNSLFLQPIEVSSASN